MSMGAASVTRSCACLFAALAGVLLIATIFWQPLPGGPRPAFWLSLLISAALLLAGLGVHRQLAVKRLAMLWACLWLPVAASWPASVAPDKTAKVVLVLLAALPVGTFWLQAMRDEIWRRRVEWAWVGILLAWAFDALVQWRLGADLFGTAMGDDGRVTGPFAETLRMADFLALLSPLAFYRLAPRWPLLATAGGLLLLAVSMLNGTRTQVVMSALVLASVLPAFNWRWRFALAVLFGLSLVALLGASDILATKAQQTLSDSPRAIPGKPEWYSQWDHRLTGRLVNWSAATAMGLANPTGVGVSGYTRAYPDYTYPGDPRIRPAAGTEINHAHHVWLSVFAEEGFPGILGLLLAIALAARWWRAGSAAARWQAAPYAACLAVYFFPVTSHHPLYLFWLFPVIWAGVCGYLACISKDLQNSPTGGPECVSR